MHLAIRVLLPRRTFSLRNKKKNGWNKSQRIQGAKQSTFRWFAPSVAREFCASHKAALFCIHHFFSFASLNKALLAPLQVGRLAEQRVDCARGSKAWLERCSYRGLSAGSLREARAFSYKLHALQRFLFYEAGKWKQNFCSRYCDARCWLYLRERSGKKQRTQTMLVKKKCGKGRMGGLIIVSLDEGNLFWLESN